MTNPASRRGFLRGLTTLPLIGGGVTLIGNPSGVAEPINKSALNAYNEWLFMERQLLCIEMYPNYQGAEGFVPVNTGAFDYHTLIGAERQKLPQPSTRAALVLATVGCDWRRDGR